MESQRDKMICQRLLAWLGVLVSESDMYLLCYVASKIRVLEMIKDITIINDNNYLMSFFFG